MPISYIVSISDRNDTYEQKCKLSQHNFRINVIKQLLATVADNKIVTETTIMQTEFSRLTGRHFVEKIPTELGKKLISRECKVCNPGEKKMHVGPPKKKYGCERFRCKQCHIVLCAGMCFGLFHTQKDCDKICYDIEVVDS